MDVIITVPNIGLEEAEVIEILVELNSLITINQSLITVEGQKASIEIPSPIAGILKKIFVSVGDKVIPGSNLVSIKTNKEKNIHDVNNVEKLNTLIDEKILNTEASISKRNTNLLPSVHASPSVRRMAREYNIDDLSKIIPTGPNNRIIKQDVENFYNNMMLQTLNAKETNNAVINKNNILLNQSKIKNYDQYGEVSFLKISSIQKKVSNNLLTSHKLIPHVTHFDFVDVTELESFRKKINIDLKKNDKHITLLSFIVKSISQTLQFFPKFNASLSKDNDKIILKKYIYIGIAVDINNGLIVPILKNPDKLSIIKIADEINRLSINAANFILKPDDIQGGSFTISNLGKIGGDGFTPIINYPEVAILGISRMRTQPLWNGDTFIPRTVIPLSLTYDHRIINGLEAAKFITFLKNNLSSMNFLIF
ncbi:Dihydrolipoyllysine-residue acetyltransferase component of pyruvate dehydrogenase complex [Buchnera aphidicola (Thelaxes suberi)]|uniref:2-oxo acid dehydrogenase subunit E2 n=1 Tax=Buchnera aphidicola TaxID=9 RepID=UPI003463C634